MAPKGVRYEKEEPVEQMSGEGALDQMLGITVDGNQKSMVFLDSVTDENDVFERCPVVGDIDVDKGPEGKSIKKALEEAPQAIRDVYLDSSGAGLTEYGSGPATDRFAVGDAKWIDNPEELIWKSALLAQLQAKHNAVAQFLTDPALLEFAKNLSEEDRKLVAQRARQLAAELQDAALNDMANSTHEQNENLKRSVMETKERFLRYVVTQEDAIKEGGLTESEVNELFEEG